MIEVDGGRLLQDLRRLAEIGRYKTGVDRPAFSDADIEARKWIAERMNDAGLRAETDRLGNVIGKSPQKGPAVMIGSHTDSVPRGGWLDGALGVVYGLEVVRALRDRYGDAAPAVDVMDFQDEEGTCVPCLGSRTVCGELHEPDFAGATVHDGRELNQAIADTGLSELPYLRLENDRYAGYMEAHIEQGPRLEHSGNQVGVVTAIVGIRRLRIAAEGRADHAGTTPMHMRRDAGATLIKVANALLERIPRADVSDDTVWNIGTIAFEPGAANVVPAAGSFVLEFRDTSATVLDRIETETKRIVSEVEQETGACKLSVNEVVRLAPTPMNQDVVAALSSACESTRTGYERLPSGAGHDAMVMARHLPSGLMFVPSIGGRSHDIAEDTDEEDIVAGCRVMANAVVQFLHSRSRS